MANVLTKTKEYFEGSYAELKKIVWPTKNQTINYSIIVVVISLGMALFFSVLDYIFDFLLKQII